MKKQMLEMVEDWDPAQKTLAFSTDEDANKAQGSDDYFLESASRTHFFAETSAVDESSALKDEYKTSPESKLRALNKAGHGMHMVEGAFRDYTLSKKVLSLVTELGWKAPVVPQSMYICKNPRIGGTVHSHQDSTFLFTTPKQSCLGLWLALDEATLENGCLWVRPKSHREPVRRQFLRNPDHFSQDVIENRSNVAKGDLEQPKMIVEKLVKDDDHTVKWEGKLPLSSDSKSVCRGLVDAGFIPIECKAGDLLVFPGQLDHLSLPNFSERQRHTFQLHMVEGLDVEWSKANWLQYPKGIRFLHLKAKP